MKNHAPVNADDHRRLIDALRRQADAGWREDLRLCLPVVLDLVTDLHDRPVRELAPAIRAVVHDRCTGKAGEVPVRDHDEMVERHVQLLVTELEKLRDRQIRRGDWSANATPPQMYG